MQHVKNAIARAQRLTDEGGEFNLRCACLSLRMCVEEIFYRLVPLYDEELPDAIKKTWQPRPLLDAIVECNPDAVHDSTLAMGEQREDGTLGPATVIGTQQGVRKELLRDFYHRLGSRLHAARVNEPFNDARTRDLIADTIQALRGHAESTLRSNIRKYAYATCSACQREIRRNLAALQLNPVVKCPNENCGEVYRVESEGEESRFHPCIGFYCPTCAALNGLEPASVVEGAQLACFRCQAVWEIRTGWFLAPASSTRG